MTYALLWGRDTPIVYRQDKFELVDSAFSLYPDECPGFTGVFNNGQTKSWNLAVFRVKENGKLFIFVSTHLWWKSRIPASSSYQAGRTRRALTRWDWSSTKSPNSSKSTAVPPFSLAI